MDKTEPSMNCFDCNDLIIGMAPGHNTCAYLLSREENWKNKNGCIALCRCGYPVNAKQVRKNIFNDFIDSDRDSLENAYIYCEDEFGKGHVYYGTFGECVKGNKKAAGNFVNKVAVFERYRSFK